MADSNRPGEEERQLLRDSVRGFLASHWPVTDAVKRQNDQDALAEIWRGLAGQGLTRLGVDASEGGLAEAVLVMEELGRAACPALIADAVVANIALSQFANPGGPVPALLDALHEGKVCIAFAVAHLGPDADGTVTMQDGLASGVLRMVAGGRSATHFLVPLDAECCAIVDCLAHGCEIVDTRALGTQGYSQVTLTRCPVLSMTIGQNRLADLHRIYRLCLLARALGAARRAFELVVEYAKERHQFGRPIGSFQAIAHKLANCHIQLEGLRLVIANAAIQYDGESANWRYFASTASAFGSNALRQVSLETHHAFGAIGYAEEHEAPRHFRTVHLDTLTMGGPRQARSEVALDLLNTFYGKLPEYDLGDAGNQFRGEVHAWLDRNWSGERKARFDALEFHDREFDASFAVDLGKTGWIGMSWPTEHGGQGRGAFEQVAFLEEMERAEAPRFGAAIQSTALMLFGTPDQQRRYLPEILMGEAMHGMGYSEPNAGSDLASLKTTAERDGDAWVINGQKIWTTTWWGKYMFLAARTNRTTKPAHAGISIFIVPMNAPGIDVKPANTMYDGTFANIFYDNVRLPADSLVGEVDGGWKVLTSALAMERGLVGGGIVLKVAHSFELLCQLILQSTVNGKPMRDDPVVRDRVAQLAAEIEVGRQLMMRCAELAQDGRTPPEYGAISKVFSSELMERFCEAALEIIGMRATLSQNAAGNLLNGRLEQGLRHSLMWVISIGTNEIQRTLIAQRGLGLPK